MNEQGGLKMAVEKQSFDSLVESVSMVAVLDFYEIFLHHRFDCWFSPSICS
jgi:hypothetical protein